jgi:hypothetical protein
MFILIGNTRKSTNWGAPTIRSWIGHICSTRISRSLEAPRLSFAFHAGALAFLQNTRGCHHFVGLMGGVPNAYDD